MDNYVGTAIEKIKLQEQDNELKIKEKREINATIVSLNRAIHNSSSVLENLIKEYERLKETNDKLQQHLFIEKTRHDALLEQINSCSIQLKELRKSMTGGISAVWEKRLKLLETNQLMSDKCDIWNLLIKPGYTETFPDNQCFNENEPLARNDERLKNAMERKKRALNERSFLLSEPETGEEFVRVRNALRYSKEISAKVGALHKYTAAYRFRRLYSNKLEVGENEPIKFTTSEAARRTTKPVMRKIDPNMPWYQPYSVVTSVAVFLIYFCVFREENDVDLEFNKTLYERIKGLEKQQLLQSYKFNKEQGKSVEDIEIRLRELEAEENKVVVE